MHHEKILILKLYKKLFDKEPLLRMFAILSFTCSSSVTYCFPRKSEINTGENILLSYSKIDNVK